MRGRELDRLVPIGGADNINGDQGVLDVEERAVVDLDVPERGNGASWQSPGHPAHPRE